MPNLQKEKSEFTKIDSFKYVTEIQFKKSGEIYMALSDTQISEYRQNGHVTCPRIFDNTCMDDLVGESQRGTDEFISGLDVEKRACNTSKLPHNISS